MLLQWIKSLFTSAGSINPVAIAMLIGATWYGFDEWLDYRDKLALNKDCGFIQESLNERLEAKDRRNEIIKKQNEIISDDDMREFLDGLRKSRDKR